MYRLLAVLEQIFSKAEKYVCYSTDSIKAWTNRNTEKPLCKKRQIRSIFWSVFSYILTEYGDLRSKFPYSVQIQANTDQKNLCIWTLFTQWAFSLHQLQMLLPIILLYAIKIENVILIVIVWDSNRSRLSVTDYNQELQKFIEYFKKRSKKKINDLTDVNLSSNVGQTDRHNVKSVNHVQQCSKKASHSIENSSTVNSSYANIQDFDLNKAPQEVSTELFPATFQRRPYPEPIPAISVTAIISNCPPNISTWFLCLKSLRETEDLCFITKSRR